MGMKQLILLILATLMVAFSIIIGFSLFNKEAYNSEKSALLSDIHYVASSAMTYWRKPAPLGGGGRTFKNVMGTESFGIPKKNLNGVLKVSKKNIDSFEITAKGNDQGIEIKAIITPNGIAGDPSVKIPKEKKKKKKKP